MTTPFEPSAFFALRTPLLPVDTLTDLSADLEAPRVLDDPVALAEAWCRDRRRLRRRLQRLVQMPTIREAIFIASPDLERAIERWLADPEGPKAEAVERALVKYVTRMSARATPFGLFAGGGVGSIGHTTRLAIGARSQCRRHTRLDMEFLVALADALAHDPRLAGSVCYTPNSSLYRSGGCWRFVETRRHGGQRTHHLVALEHTAALEATIERARDGATRAALASALIDDDIGMEEADRFVGELIDGQILIPDIECAITGDEPVGRLVRLLRRAPAGEPVAQRLTTVACSLEALDASGLGADPDRYRAIARELEVLPVGVDQARLFQVDVVRPTVAATLDRALVDELVRAADILRRLSPAADQDPLERFRTAFAARYDRREVPLVEALDPESGVASALVEGGDRDASELLRGLDFPPSPVSTMGWGRREAHLLRRVGETLIAGGHELALTADDVDEMANLDAAPLPDACALIATLIPASRGPADTDRLLLHHVSGPSGARLLGRFCHADPDLVPLVAAHLRDEEALEPDALFAEIAHLPEGRQGNVLLRPVLRGAEIPYLGRSGAARQIPVTDLTLQLADDHRFVLRSRRLGCRIVPRLTSAHNFTRHTLGTYRLLCLLQGDGRLPGCAWTWSALESLPFLPRVTCGRVVFARAAWRVLHAEIRTLIAAGPGLQQYVAVQRWRATRRLPRWVVLADADNTLPIDLDNALAVDALIHLLADRQSATLTELLPDAEQRGGAEGEDGRYTHELVIPCVRTGTLPPRSESEVMQRGGGHAITVRRTFAPGARWVYAKLYAGANTSDRLLSTLVGPVSRALLAQGAIDRWFFVRYADPDEHLRWRLRVAGRTLDSRVRRQIERRVGAAMAEGLVRRLTFDTYEREVERYGGESGIEVAESYFWADSEAILDLLDESQGMPAEQRWRAAIPGIDRLLADFGLDLEAKLQSLRTLRERFGREFRVGAPLTRQLAAKYRAHERALQRLLTEDASSPSVAWRSVFARRSDRARAALAHLRASARTLGLVESYVHMHMNRLFRAEPRAHELVVYDFLSRLYTGCAARRRSGA